EIHGAKWVPGKVGSALEFNGESDYVEIKDTAKNSPFAITSMSISAWINPSAYPKGAPVFWAGIAGKAYYGESTYGLRIGSDGKVFFNVYGPFGEAGKIKSFLYGRESKTKVSLNQWHYVAVTYDNENVKFYLDGRLDSVYKENRLPEINKQSIFIGSTYAKGRYFKGIIDEVKIYKGALTDAEVVEEYKKGGGTARLTSGNLPKINEAPSLDGALSDPCWQKALKVDLVSNNTGKTPKAPTAAYTCYDDKNLYIAFLCKEPFMDKIKANVTERGGAVWNDDCVEIFIDPGLSRKNYYHFMVNSKNVQSNAKWDGPNNEERGWDGEWQSSTSLQPDGWTAEIKIPLSNFALASDVGSSWGINLCRERKTEPENTSWSPTFGAFHSPEKFGTIREFNADVTPYKIAVSAPALNYSFKDNKPSLQLTQSFINSSKEPRQVNIRIQNLSGNESISKDMVLLPGKAQEVILPINVKKDGNQYQLFRTEITNSADEAKTYCASRMAECPALMQSCFDRSCYVSEKKANLEGSISINEKLPDNLGIRVAMLSRGKKVSEKTVRISGAKFNVPVDIASLPAGEYNAAVSMIHGKDIIYTESLRLVKYPAETYVTRLDSKNLCMLANDKPFFPIGITAIPDLAIPEYAEAGFNITTRSSPDIAYYNGMMTVASSYYTIPREHYKTLQPEKLEDELMNKGSLPAVIKNHKNHPAFAGYFWDEPAPEEVKGVEILSKVTRDLDPCHLIMPAFYQRTGPTIPGSLYDIYIADIYWYNAPLSKKCNFYSTIKNCANIAEEMRKPFWYMPSAAGWNAQSAITPQEQRVQTYLGLIYGARGIFYWTYGTIYPAMSVAVKQLAGEMRDLSPVLLTLSPKQTIIGADKTEVHALAKIYNGDCYLLTANNSADEEKTIRLKVSAVAGAKSAKVLFENRIVPIVGNVIEDKFAPYATHVYVLPKADTKKPIEIAIEKLASTKMPLPKVRRWPDIDILNAKIGNPGFEEEEDGQPRLWSSSWEMPEYCSLSSSEYYEGSKSLKLYIPQATRYTQKNGFGWSGESNVKAFDLGKLRQKCRYGHTVKNGLFKVNLPNGRYTVTVLSSTAQLFAMKDGNRLPITIKTVEIPVPKGIEHTIKENTFDVTVKGGPFGLFMPSGAIYSLRIVPERGAVGIQAFEFRPNGCSTTLGYKLVSASKVASATAISCTVGEGWPRIKLKDGVKYKLSVYMKSDTPNLSIRFGMREGVPWGSEENKTVKIGTQWAKYEMPVTKKGEWVFVQLNTPGTVWVDDFALEH
ncbi:MAG TPA: hypothetical protein DCL60_08315, partial [Armatimonadetes bacterium]|nr:hypothetical protein [Armatimonadota bacterium]